MPIRPGSPASLPRNAFFRHSTAPAGVVRSPSRVPLLLSPPVSEPADEEPPPFKPSPDDTVSLDQYGGHKRHEEERAEPSSAAENLNFPKSTGGFVQGGRGDDVFGEPLVVKVSNVVATKPNIQEPC